MRGVLTPKKNQKNQKKPIQFTNFGVATGFFWVFLVFLGWYSNPKFKYQKNQKIPKKPKKTKKKTTKRALKTSFNFECWPRPMPKNPKKKNQKKPKKNQFPISNSGQNQCQKNQKKPKKTNANLEILKNQKKTKKTNANLPILV